MLGGCCSPCPLSFLAMVVGKERTGWTQSPGSMEWSFDGGSRKEDADWLATDDGAHGGKIWRTPAGGAGPDPSAPGSCRHCFLEHIIGDASSASGRSAVDSYGRRAATPGSVAGLPASSPLQHPGRCAKREALLLLQRAVPQLLCPKWSSLRRRSGWPCFEASV